MPLSGSKDGGRASHSYSASPERSVRLVKIVAIFGLFSQTRIWENMFYKISSQIFPRAPPHLPGEREMGKRVLNTGQAGKGTSPLKLI